MEFLGNELFRGQNSVSIKTSGVGYEFYVRTITGNFNGQTL